MIQKYNQFIKNYSLNKTSKKKYFKTQRKECQSIKLFFILIKINKLLLQEKVN
jgi:hypothetical protein